MLSWAMNSVANSDDRIHVEGAVSQTLPETGQSHDSCNDATRTLSVPAWSMRPSFIFRASGPQELKNMCIT